MWITSDGRAYFVDLNEITEPEGSTSDFGTSTLDEHGGQVNIFLILNA